MYRKAFTQTTLSVLLGVVLFSNGGFAAARDIEIAAGTSSLSEVTRAQRPEARAYLGNNPRCKLIPWRHPDTGKVDEGESVPSLVVDLTHLPHDGEWKISATVMDRNRHELVLLESNASSSRGRIHYSWHLDAPLADPYSVHLMAKQGSYVFEEAMSLRVYRLFGKVTDFNGKPVKATVHANGLEGVATLTDNDGGYTLWLPGIRIRALNAYDVGICKDTVETWIYDYRPQDDLRLDLRVGQLEVYELHAWRGYLGVKVDFSPMSISHILRCLEPQAKGKGAFAPSFVPDDITVMADGTQARNVSIDKRKLVFFGRDLPPGFDMPDPQDEYSLQVAVPDCSPGSEDGSVQVIKIALQHHYKEEGHEFTEQGEAFYLGLRNGCGMNAGYEY